ncbi:DMT family transporter [Rhizobium puerariae]|uniref:DMT family transporter n=1 Tax=Rhizobium puerariae TaxID=1585791 RepID=A0ABV6AI78_9HYPH
MDPRKGILLKISATLSLVLMGACISALGGDIPIGQVVFFRSAIALLPLCIWMAAQGGLRKEIATRHIGGHLVRSFSGTGGMVFSYLALAYLPLADATAISYATPLFTVVLAALLLKEVVRIYRWTAIVIGLCGILVILSPHASWEAWDMSSGSAVAMTGGIFGLTAAVFSAISMIQIRHLTQTENTGAIVFYFTILTTAIGFASIALGWNTPTGWQMALLVGAGLFGGIAQILVTLSLRYAEASLLAPFDYTTMIWALLIGYAFMDQVPPATTIAGASTVIAAGLFTLWREKQLRRRRVAAEQLVLSTSR